MPQPLGILLDVPGADDHPLKVVVRLADVVDGRREQHTPPELLAVVVRIEAQREQLAVSRRLDDPCRRLGDVLQMTEQVHRGAQGFVIPLAFGPKASRIEAHQFAPVIGVKNPQPRRVRPPRPNS